jgi:hypothetical protein
MSTVATPTESVSAGPVTDDVLQVRNLRTWFKLDEGTVKALDGATFNVQRSVSWARVAAARA